LSQLITIGAGGLLGFLLASGFTEVKQFIQGGISIITGKDADGKAFEVQFANEALINPQYDLITLSTGALTKKSDKPQFEIKNTATGDKRIYTIGIVPDATFKAESILEIFLNEVRLFPISAPVGGMFANVSSLNIPIPANFGLKIKQDFKLEVFIYNPLGNASTISFSVFIANIA